MVICIDKHEVNHEQNMSRFKLTVQSKLFKLSGLLKCASAAIFTVPSSPPLSVVCVRSSLEQAKGCSELFTENEWVRGVGLIRE